MGLFSVLARFGGMIIIVVFAVTLSNSWTPIRTEMFTGSFVRFERFRHQFGGQLFARAKTFGSVLQIDGLEQLRTGL